MSTPLQTAVPIARALLAKAIDEGASITPLQAIKLASIAHGWHLAISDTPLTDEPVQAWKYGPVFRSLYNRYRSFGNNPIRDKFSRKPLLSTEAHEIIDSVWDNYGHLDGGKLINLTHARGTPWNEVFQRCGGRLPMGETISNDLIKEHFEKLAEA